MSKAAVLSILSSVCVATSLVAPKANASLITNGDFGSFSGAIPDGWTQTEAGLTSSQSLTNSPFTNVLPNNGSSWSVIDDATVGTDGFYQFFSLTTLSRIEINYDFSVATLTNNPWGVQFDNNANSAVHFRIDTAEGSVSNQFAINGGAGVVNVLTLQANTWYNVQAVLNDTAGTIVGTITPFGGSSVAFSTSMLATHAGFTRILLRDRTTLQSGNLLLDNVAVVPEPGTVALFGLSALGLLALHARHRQRQAKI